MRIGLTLPTMMPGLDRPTLLAWCHRIDAGPFATLAAGERLTFANTEIMVSMAAAAAVTTRVELMLTVVVLPLHSAAVVAKQVATLDVLAAGRVTMGVGVGGRAEDFRAAGAPHNARFRRMEAQVETCRRIWRGTPLEDGMAPIGPVPGRGDALPILVGALSHDSIRRAARWADGLCGFSFGPDATEVSAAFDVAREAWRAQGRRPPRLVTSAWVSIAADGRAQMDAYARRYLDVFGAPTAKSLARLCTTTSAPALRDAVRQMADAGADDFLLVPTTTDPEEVDRLGDLVGGLPAA
jgi:alkanesulfonate monooxygenase SsuD/methylene tetrahydromethanopterin reductase-like flavin-dependent oxidoreductase (luciferase family)